MGNAGDLTGNTGAVLDPVLALRKNLTIPANGSTQVVFTTFAARDRGDAVEQSQRFSSITEAGKPFDIGNTRESQLLDSLAINSWKAGTFQALTSRLLYEARTFHADDWGKPRGGGRDGLVALGVTAEWPILYSNLGQLPLEHVGHSLSMYLYWRAKGIATDLVMFCDDEASALEVRAHVSKIISTLKLEDLFDQPTGIRIIPVDSADMDTYRLLTSVAHNVGGASRHRVPARV
jgi:cyclic beta-1,2-glucan synthetase